MKSFDNFSSDFNFTNNSASPECIEFTDILGGDPIDTVEAHVTFAILYLIVWLLAVFGNTVVIYVAVVERLSLTVRTVFIVSLAGSDLAIAFSALPATAVTTFTHTWEFPAFTCHGVSFLQGVSVFLSSFTLMAIAVDRYLLIVYPHRNFITYSVARNSVFVMFLIGVLLSLPMAIFADVIVVKLEKKITICGVICTEEWPKELTWLKTFYGLAVPTLQFVVPLIITTYCYYEIGRQMKIRYKIRQKQEHLLKKSEQKESDRRRRANRMMASMVLTFVAAWFPLSVLNVIRDLELFATIGLPTIYFNLLFATFHFLAMTSLIMNLFIYGFFHESFRTTITNLCRTRSQKRQLKNSRSLTNAMGSTAANNRRDTMSKLPGSGSNKTLSTTNGAESRKSYLSVGVSNLSPSVSARFEVNELGVV